MMGLRTRAEPLMFLAWIAALTLAGCAGSGDVSSMDRHDPGQFPLFELAPDVRSIFESPGPRAQTAFNYLKYANALVNDVDALDASVAQDVQLHELEGLGLTGLAGLTEFRRQRNDSFVYDRAVVMAMRFPEAEIIEVDLCTERTDAASGARRTIMVYARNRWVDDKLVERWDRAEELPPDGNCGSPAGR